MAVPELYSIGRSGQLFGLYRFGIYMLDGIYQVSPSPLLVRIRPRTHALALPQSAIIYFFILYSYDTTTSRSDGYDIGMYEFSVSSFPPRILDSS